MAMKLMERLSIHFKGPLTKYVFTVIDEYSRFPFRFPCRDMESQIVIPVCHNCLRYSAIGVTLGLHRFRISDRGASFMSN